MKTTHQHIISEAIRSEFDRASTQECEKLLAATISLAHEVTNTEFKKVLSQTAIQMFKDLDPGYEIKTLIELREDLNKSVKF